MRSVPQLRAPGEMAVIGLGVGTMAAYAQPGQRWTFFEIDPAIERIARNEEYFTFLDMCGAQCQVVLGDARLSLAARTGPVYKLIVLDAFSSDAIPMHLLTQEAMRLYLSRLAPDGVLVFHISNRHLRLDHLVGWLAAVNGMVALERREVQSARDWPPDKTPSHWVVMARSGNHLGTLAREVGWAVPPLGVSETRWTDDFSNILDVLEIRVR
jgi:spermidine synthase